MPPSPRRIVLALAARSPVVVPAAMLACLVALAACDRSPEQMAADARKSLDGGEPAQAVEQVEAALAKAAEKGSEPRVVWELERLHVDALARTGRGDDLRNLLEDLATRFQAQVTPALYMRSAEDVAASGDKKGATDLLHAAVQRFPEASDELTKQIRKIAESGVDDATRSQLESLGYL